MAGLLLALPLSRAQAQAPTRDGQDGPAAADDQRLFPRVRYFESPVADPHEPRFSIGLAYTNLFESRGPERPLYTISPGSRPEVQAEAAVGATIPLVLLARWPGGGIVVGAQAGVMARFRIELPSRDDLGQDWVVAMPIEILWDDASARIRIVHRSAHLGDEFAEATGARRIEFGGETLDLLVASRFGGWRVYAGGGWIFHSNTDNTQVLRQADRPDRYSAQLGSDGEWRPFSDARVSILAGIDWQSAERSNWRSEFALAAGVRIAMGSRDARLLARYLDGGSAMGQFFLTPERVFSLELGFGL